MGEWVGWNVASRAPLLRSLTCATAWERGYVYLQYWGKRGAANLRDGLGEVHCMVPGVAGHSLSGQHA